jgi:hypothetical protein
MTLSRRIAQLERRRTGKPALSPRLLALAMALCEGETADL